MLTRYLTSVSTAFSPFNPKSGKTARTFLAMLPPNARQSMTFDVKMLGQAQKSVPATLALKFSECFSSFNPPQNELSCESRRGFFLGQEKQEKEVGNADFSVTQRMARK